MARAVPERARDRAELAEFLRQDVGLHLYELGDLDDWFWPDATFYAVRERGALAHVVLRYEGGAVATLLGLSRQPSPGLVELVRHAAGHLPRRAYAHLSPGLASELAPSHRLEPHGAHDKMLLSRPARLTQVDVGGVDVLAPADRAALEQLYRDAYPDNWFEPRMLETGHYVGIWQRGRLVSAAGVHVVSATYRAAALGNVATLPSHRGRGLATRACAKLCRRLLLDVDHVGLNVDARNRGAIACYRRLGFERVAGYEEWQLERR